MRNRSFNKNVSHKKIRISAFEKQSVKARQGESVNLLYRHIKSENDKLIILFSC